MKHYVKVLLSVFCMSVFSSVYSQEQTKKEKRSVRKKTGKQNRKTYFANEKKERTRTKDEDERLVATDLSKIFIATDIDFASSTSDTRKEAKAGTGTLGVNFKKGFLFGGANFTVYSQNQDISTSDSLETKLFGTNLLLPQNSSSDISNFSFYIGTRSFYGFDKVSTDRPMFSLTRFGANTYFNVNNTTWIKDSISLPTTISSFGVNLTYEILNEQILDSKDKIRLLISFGWTARRLGGDYGLSSNIPLRNSFVGTERLGFDGTNIGFRLEVSKFFGEMNLTTFDRKRNIAGFSGNQAIIRLGILADLGIPTKSVKKK